MKLISTVFLIFCLLLNMQSNAQQLPPPGTPSVARPTGKNLKKTTQKNEIRSPRLFFNAGIGIANYLGDLVKDNTAFVQSSFSFNAGLHYSIHSHINTRFDLGFHQVQGYDSKSGGAHPGRNLSFKSKIIEFSLAAEFTLMNMNTHRLSPFLFAGIGAFSFNPRAYFGAGGTHGLRELGTEGQGLPGYPGLYSKMAVQFPLGFGLKYKVNDKVMLLGEFNFRFTGTDYLDDVSTFYPNKALLDARNPSTAAFTYRGNGGYPINPILKRGDPDQKDAYYTSQLKLSYKLGADKKEKTDKTKIKLPVKKNGADTDQDGIADAQDKCPEVPGSIENNGCPFPYIEGANLAAVSSDSMTYRLFFDLDRAQILSDAFKTLQGIIGILNADDSLKVNIMGHSDNLGTDAAILQLSAERATIIRDYLLSYNIPADRITTSHYGKTMPLDDTQQWRNRRVEISILKK